MVSHVLYIKPVIQERVEFGYIRLHNVKVALRNDTILLNNSSGEYCWFVTEQRVLYAITVVNLEFTDSGIPKNFPVNLFIKNFDWFLRYRINDLNCVIIILR